jgi:hypothetical protein
MFVVSIFEAGQPKSLAEGKCVMAHFVKVGSRAELEDLEGGKLVEADGQCIAVFNIGGSYYAIDIIARALIGAALSQREW